ncbi:YciI family protein [Terriglobus sp. RCC_193]|uniref:YciI family protein n=1 Tax=Terriglobus sp. RCC_193 TaxID=3239218 RepID=UPI0035245810
MPQFLIAVQHPNNYDPSLEGDDMIRDISALNQEMDAAGARFFAGGLESPSHAKSLRKQPNGNVSVTDGPYLEAKEYIGGFWILECADMDEALAWARKAVIACRVPVEVREFHRSPPKENPTNPSTPLLLKQIRSNKCVS